MKTMRGFTLLELMMVLAITGVLLAWGVPSFQQMLASNRLVTNANNLVYTFQLARSEAIARGRSIDIVAATGGWENGWSVEEPDPADPACPATDATTIKNWEAMVGTPDITYAATCYRYDAQGRLSASGTLTICDDRTGENGRQVNLNKIGRIYLSELTCT